MPIPSPIPGQPAQTGNAGAIGADGTAGGAGSMGGNYLNQSNSSSTGGNIAQMGPAGGVIPLQGTGANPAWNADTKAVGGNQTPGFQYGMADAGAIDQSKIAGAQMPNMAVDQGENYQNKMQNAYYEQQQARLDPQWKQTQGDLETQLQNMGLTRGSEAWNREMTNMQQGKNDAYNQASRESILNSGAEAQRRQQMDIAAGTFGNQATQQNFENQMASQTQQNAQQQQQFGQNLQSAGLNNAALTAQQQAGQGWKSIDAQNNASQAGLAAAQAAAGATMGAAQLNAALGQRQQEEVERGNLWNRSWDAQFKPVELQNLKIGGMNPGNPAFGTVPGTQGAEGYAAGTAAGQKNIGSGIATGATDPRLQGSLGDIWKNISGSLGGFGVGQPEQLSGPGMP